MPRNILADWIFEFQLAFGVTAALCALVFWVYYLMVKSSSKPRYPPGPPGNLLLGNILDVPPEAGWTKLTELEDVYGEIVFFHGLGNHVLVLNSLRAIHDLFDKRGAIYSDRPSFTVVGELMGLGQSMPLLPYGEEWKTHRRLAHAALGPGVVKRYYSVQADLAALMAQALVKDPQDFFSHVRLTASRFILAITYGLSVHTADNKYISHAEETMHIISEATVPGAFLCDLLPCISSVLDAIPEVKQEMAEGTASPSFTYDLLSTEDSDNPALGHQIMWTAGALYGAGGETTYATVLNCIMAMALHPDKLHKAQEEIDNIIGTERMPRIGDRGDLPYVDAVIKETMRWHPSLPLGIARATAAADVYEGFRIPKGTIVIPNVWAVAFAPEGPYDPHTFAPERSLVTNEKDMPTDPGLWAFGFARRICPGRYLAENSVFILIATVLAMFDIAVPDGKELRPTFTKGLISYPEPFECKITVRSEAKRARILARAGQCAV